MGKEDMEKVISRTASAMDKAIAFDTEIADNRLKYSLWVVALATSGFALIVFSIDKISKFSWFRHYPLILISLFAIACLLFFASIFFGAWFYQLTNKQLMLFKQQRTLIYRQEVTLLNRPEEFENTSAIDEIFRKHLPSSFIEYEFFDPNDERYKQLRNQALAGSKKLERLLFLQQILVAIGFVIILILGFPNPKFITPDSGAQTLERGFARPVIKPWLA